MLFILSLVMALAFFGAGLGILKVSNAKNIGMGLETIYGDRVKPLRQLKMLSDIYGINMIDTANKVYGGNITWH
jgi:methyl-accepting chemotaxis protein